MDILGGIDWAVLFALPATGWKRAGVAVGLMDYDRDGQRDDIAVRASDPELRV